MKCFRLLTALAFLFTACIIILRPALVFHSNALQLTLVREASTCGLVKAVRKRKERVPQMENQRESIVVSHSTAIALTRLRKMLMRNFIKILAVWFGGHALFKASGSVFEREYQGRCLLYLSQFRI